MTDDESKALMYIKKVFKITTAADLHDLMARLTKRIKMESIKESNPREKHKSKFTD